MSQPSQETRTLLQTLLDGVEQVGNKVPHPAVIFLVLMGVVVLLSHAFSVLGTSVSYQRINPQTHDIEDLTATVNSLLSADGIRFLFTSAVRNFLNFGPVGVILVAMVGVGLAAAFSGVGAVFDVNLLITPIDGILTEITNDAIHLLDPSYSIDLTANLYFAIVSSLVLCVVCTVSSRKNMSSHGWASITGRCQARQARACQHPKRSPGDWHMRSMRFWVLLLLSLS